MPTFEIGWIVLRSAAAVAPAPADLTPQATQSPPSTTVVCRIGRLLAIAKGGQN